MKPLSFKNRIASYYIITTALLIFAVFFVIFAIVKYSVYSNVNKDIKKEVAKHLREIEVIENCVLLIREQQWKIKQINTVEVSPAFIQFVDELGALVEKSPNLKLKRLTYYPNEKNNELFDAKFDDITVRQIQVPLYQGEKIIGYLIVATSLENSMMVLDNLFKILIIAFPLVLLLLFLIARFIAGRSIKPISSIIKTANIITRDNLTSRIQLPQNKDELHLLSKTINELLNRIENAIEREKQFTSDASHEFRTPLAVIKGTLEVLVRKERSHEEYKEKIEFCVKEVNRLNELVDELLLLARFENQKQNLKLETLHLNTYLMELVTRNSSFLVEKNIKFVTNFKKEYYSITDQYLFSIIINNLLTNAIKYSKQNGKIIIDCFESDSGLYIAISDFGIGIAESDLNKIFDQFYRSKSTNHPNIKGTGLGLSIVKRLCELLDIAITIDSKENDGTKVTLQLKKM
jgi:signal transduction histidine kinase